MPRQTYYSKDWEDKSKYKDIAAWVSGEEGATTFNCSSVEKKNFLSVNIMSKRKAKKKKT